LSVLDWQDFDMAFDHLPLADAGYEAWALRLFKLEMAPDEYAARFGHEFVLFSFANYRYTRPGLTEWVQRLGDIFFKRNGAPTLRELRQRFLSHEEMAEVERYEEEPL
jgi:hypothetical protein